MTAFAGRCRRSHSEVVAAVAFWCSTCQRRVRHYSEGPAARYDGDGSLWLWLCASCGAAVVRPLSDVELVDSAGGPGGRERASHRFLDVVLPDQRTCAEYFVAGLLADGPLRASRVLAYGRLFGLSEWALRQAKASLGVKSVRRGARWWWVPAWWKAVGRGGRIPSLRGLAARAWRGLLRLLRRVRGR